MTDIDLDALEATARAATPGPWQHTPFGGQNQNGDYFGGDVFDGHGEYLLSEVRDEDGAHIATFDPTTALALIARLREAEDERDDLESRLAELLCDLTDGRMSKTSYDVRTMVSEVEGTFERASQAEIQVYANAATDAGARLREAEAVIEDIRVNAAELLDADDDSYDGSLSATWVVDLIARHKTTKTDATNRENGSND